jgi:hypothetical protein
LFLAKGGGSANKTFLYQKTKSLLNDASLDAFIREKIKDLGIGIFAIPKEEHSQNSKKAGKKVYELGIGAFSLSKEKRTEISRECGKKTSSQKWKCLITGHISTPCGLSRYQKARGIDTTKRIKIDLPCFL